MDNSNQKSGRTIQAKPSLPVAVLPVKTAVPVFIGYTEKQPQKDSRAQAKLISSVEEYETWFGKTPLDRIAVTIRKSNDSDNESNPASAVEIICNVPCIKKMWYHIQMYFSNGGGPCYIISAGDSSREKADAEDLLAGIDAARNCDGATLLVCPQIEDLDAADAAKIYHSMLIQCGEMKNRFAVLDCFDNQNSFRVRDTVGTQYLSYGAVYHPYLKTNLSVLYDESSLEIEYSDDAGPGNRIIPFVDLTEELKVKVRNKLRETAIILPPSSAIAGAYAHNDATKNVWTAPADIVLKSVISPTILLDEKDQSIHLADATAGKSINVIRAITHKGSVVIGARTLLGKDDKWRYISMRRTFMMIENSLIKSVRNFSGEENNVNTWVRIQLLAENFLMSLLYKGVLQGAKPDHAFSVKIGLGESMAEEDILNGNMILEIGLAMIIPSDFIFLRITQKMDGKDL